MTDEVENGMTMVNRTVLLCENNMTTVESVPKFKAKYLIVKGMRDDADGISQLLYANTHGITLNKGKKKELGAVQSFVIAKVLVSIGNETGDLDLVELMNKSLTHIREIRDADFWNFGKMVYDKAWALRTSLPDYGIEEEQITEMMATMDAYRLVEQQPRLTTLDLEQKRVNLEVKVKDIKSFMKNELDTLAVVFMSTKPDFYAIYKKARRIPKTSRHKLNADELENKTGAIDLTVVDALTLEGIEGVLYQIASIEFSDTTDETGGGYVDGLLANSYIMTLSCVGFVTKTETFDVAEGEYKVVTVQMVKEEGAPDEPPVS